MIQTPAIIVSVRPYGENAAVVRIMTPHHGLCSGYIAGARSRQMRPVLIPGNRVDAELRDRGGDQLGTLRVELVASCAALLAEPIAVAATEWATLATVTLLAEQLPYADVYSALTGLIDAIALAPAARGWAAALVHYELLLLSRTGFGLQLDSCVVSGTDQDLAFVSPRSAAAVSTLSAMGRERQLLALPLFVRIGGPASLDDALIGLRLSGHFIAQQISGPRRDDILGVRHRLIDRLQRAL